MLRSPRALLLDFGGVIVTSDSGASDVVMPRLAARVHRLIGGVLTEDEILAEMVRADALRDQIREAEDRVEVTPARLWGELVADLWPQEAREAVEANAFSLTYEWAKRPGWRLMPGMAELLEHTLNVGLPVAVVSNTRCGQAHRDLLEQQGISSAFAVQIYSDEIGLIKPHPELIRAATRNLGVPEAACWMVGDQVSRDIECARRAGTGAAILMAAEPHPAADATVADGHALLKLLQSAR